MIDMFKIEELTEEEFQAVYDWIDTEKDVLPQPLKDGLLKLVNNETKRIALRQDKK